VVVVVVVTRWMISEQPLGDTLCGA
jgi:hypothetical protein